MLVQRLRQHDPQQGQYLLAGGFHWILGAGACTTHEVRYSWRLHLNKYIICICHGMSVSLFPYSEGSYGSRIGFYLFGRACTSTLKGKSTLENNNPRKSLLSFSSQN